MKKILIILLLVFLYGCNSNDNNNTINNNEFDLEEETEITSEIETTQTEETTTNKAQLEEENRKIYEAKAHAWLSDYDGEWVIDDLMSYFFAVGTIDEPDYDGTIPSPDDKYIGQTLKIDLKNNKFTIYNDDSFKIVCAEEISKKYLEISLFSPNSQGVGAKYIDKIWYGDKNKTKKQTVKDIVLEKEYDHNPETTTLYELIITADGDLLISVGAGGGTYTLRRK